MDDKSEASLVEVNYGKDLDLTYIIPSKDAELYELYETWLVYSWTCKCHQEMRYLLQLHICKAG